MGNHLRQHGELHFMDSLTIILIFFPYGLAFFSMGIVLAFERGRGYDPRLQHALRPLAAFGLIHGFHEWIEMFQKLGLLPFQEMSNQAWSAFRIAILAFSFLSLAAFGAFSITPNQRTRHLSMMAPYLLVAFWGFGLLSLRGRYGLSETMWNVADVWTRYLIAIPAAILASVGLITQQRTFRKAGMNRFGRDSLWAAIAFVWYGIVGQLFVNQSPLPPSNIINQELFYNIFRFPVQLLRAAAAVAVAIFVTRFLRSFEVERQSQLDELQVAQLKEAQRREAMRGELLKRVVDAQEAERKRIARELHDATGQALTALGMGLRGISSNLPEDAEEAINNLKQLESLAVKSLDELRLFISDLRPSHLDDLGLRSAIRWYMGEMQERVPFDIALDLSSTSCDLPASIKTALFRVAQEALTNIIKHAQADHVRISLEYRKNGDVSLEVEDDGVGFDPRRIQMMNEPTWGLLGMQERTILCGGDFSLHTAPGEGTVVQILIPGKALSEIEENYENKNISS